MLSGFPITAPYLLVVLMNFVVQEWGGGEDKILLLHLKWGPLRGNERQQSAFAANPTSLQVAFVQVHQQTTAVVLN